MFSQDKLQDFMVAATGAMELQVIPAIFSDAQRAEMTLPHHSPEDHYHCGFLGGNEFRDMAPQISIDDPRISQQQIDQALNKISFHFDGQDYDFDVRVYQSTRGKKDLSKWQKDVGHTQLSRQAIDAVAPKLQQQFQLAVGQDFSISHGQRANYTAAFTITLTQQTDAQRKADIEAYADTELKKVITDRPVSVSVHDQMPSAYDW